LAGHRVTQRFPSAWVERRSGRDRRSGRGLAEVPIAGIELSIVIPCLNEARTLAGCIDASHRVLGESGIAGEVLVADNGSTDGSSEIAEAHGARVVHVLERGYGAALRGGVESAWGTYVICADADGQHDYHEIPRILEKLRGGDDLVVGNRFGGSIEPGAMMWSHRYIGNPLISGLVRLLFHPGVHDAQSGLRGFSRVAFAEMDLRTTGFELCAEMVVKAARRRMRISEVPITVRPDERHRAPHLRTIPDGFRHLTFVLMCSPTWLFIVPGMLVALIGIALVSWLFAGSHEIGHTVLDTRAEIFGILLASLGLNVANIGLFARVFAYRKRAPSEEPFIERHLMRLRLEQGLAIGCAFVLAGLAGAGIEVGRWALGGFHLLGNDRAVIFWSMWTVLGVQICFASFFLSMLGISRGTWIGERS
jgi:hypothetical protein